MVKSTMLKKRDEKLLDNFSELSDASEDDTAMGGVLGALIDASNNQMKFAIELTKVIVNKNAEKIMDADDIFSIFRQASTVIADNGALKELLQTFLENN